MSMNEWKPYNFSEFVDINPSLKLDGKREYSFIEMKDLDAGKKFAVPSSRRKPTGGARFEEKDTLFARITPCLENGKICQAKDLEGGIGFGSTEFLVFRGKKDISDTDFVYYLSRSEIVRKFAEQNLVGTSGRQRVGKEAFQNLEVNVPPLAIQKRIASTLSSLDEKIELNRQTAQTLEAIAQAIFKEWFVDFNFPGATGEMQESELGEIPKGWKVGKLRELIELNPKLSIKKGSVSNYVEMKDLSETSLSINRYVEREFTSGSKFQNGDTLFARITPCLENGKTGFVDFLNEGEIGWGSTEFIVLRGKTVSPYFVYCLSRFDRFREFAIQSMVGSSGRQRVVESILADYTIAIPPKEIIDTFHEKAKSLFEVIKTNHEQIKTLTELRDNLLPKLMKGELSLND